MENMPIANNEKKKPVIEEVRELLARSKPQIQLALPRHITADRLIRVSLTSIRKSPKLLQCDKISLLGAIIQSAQLGLEPDGITGLAYLVPFWNSKKKTYEVQLIPGYKGLMNLARRSGDIGAIEARVVYQKDDFIYRFGLNPVLSHRPYEGVDDPGDVIYAYALAHFKDGSMPQFEVMTIDQINKIKSRSQAKDSGPWVTDTEEMMKKTVIRRLLKYAPTSVEVQRAISLEEQADANIPQDLGSLIDVESLKEEDKPKPIKETELFPEQTVTSLSPK